MAAETQDGRDGGVWDLTPIEDLGWVAGAVGVRSNRGYAVTRTGRIGTFLFSLTSSHDALTRLAALPEPSPTPSGGAAERGRRRIPVAQISP